MIYSSKECKNRFHRYRTAHPQEFLREPSENVRLPTRSGVTRSLECAPLLVDANDSASCVGMKIGLPLSSARFHDPPKCEIN